jgi:cytochrome c553
MTINQAVKSINDAPKGEALATAQQVIAELSDADRQEVGAWLEEMAIVIDEA